MTRLNLFTNSNLPRTVWILGFSSLFTDVSSEMIHSILPLYLIGELHASAAFVGLVDGLGEAIASGTKLVSGTISDIIGRRKPLVVSGYGFSVLAKPLFALAGNPYIVLAARCLDRTGKGIRAAPRDALIADCTDPKNRGAAYGLRQSLDSVGAFIGPLVAVAVLSAFTDNYRLVLWFAVVPGIVTVLLLVFGIKERPEQASQLSPRTQKRFDFHSVKTLGRPFWAILAMAFVFTLGNSSDAFILLKGRQVGVPINFIPLTFVVMNVVYSLVAFPAGHLSDSWGKKSMLACSFALYAAVYAGFALTTANWHFWLLLCAYGLYLGLSQGTLLAIVAEVIPENGRGTAFGLLNLVIGVGSLPASLLGGWLWQTISPAACFFAGTAFACVALIVLFLMVPNSGPRPDDAQSANA